MVELATVVSFKEPNQRAKCKAKNIPEKNKRYHSLFEILLNSFLFIQTTGKSNKLARIIRYILKIVAGALDHFTKIAANEIATIETINGNTIDLEVFQNSQRYPIFSFSFSCNYYYPII